MQNRFRDTIMHQYGLQIDITTGNSYSTQTIWTWRDYAHTSSMQSISQEQPCSDYRADKIRIHYSVPGGQMIVTCHSKTSLSSTSPRRSHPRGSCSDQIVGSSSRPHTSPERSRLWWIDRWAAVHGSPELGVDTVEIVWDWRRSGPGKEIVRDWERKSCADWRRRLEPGEEIGIARYERVGKFFRWEKAERGRAMNRGTHLFRSFVSSSVGSW